MEKQKKTICKMFALILSTVLPIVAFSGCGKKYYEYTSFAMGSLLEARIYADKPEQTSKIFNDISSAASAADLFLSATNGTSDISKLNSSGCRRVDEYTLQTLKDSILLCNSLDRKIDITMGGVTELWGFAGENPTRPSDDAIKKALESVGVEKVEINSENSSVTLGEGQKLDLGAFGKGAACDAVFDVLSTKNVSAVVNLGGAVLVYGEGPASDGKWKIGVRNPFSDKSDFFATLSLEPIYPKNAAFISTSGSCEKFFEENGKKYHHILSTETGFPVESALISVTVVSQSGINSDALSTACFINGFNERTMQWLKYYFAEAVFVFNDGTYFVTEGLKDSFALVEKASFSPHTEQP